MENQSSVHSEESGGDGMNAIEKARQAARKAIEQYHYDGICTVTEHKKVKNDKTKLTAFEDVVILEKQPCHLVFKTITSTEQSESAAAIKQTTKLLLSPDVIIKPGSKITVTQEGMIADYTCSGVPATYQTHQEIVLELFGGWA